MLEYGFDKFLLVQEPHYVIFMFLIELFDVDIDKIFEIMDKI
jgi:hypothetical protein